MKHEFDRVTATTTDDYVGELVEICCSLVAAAKVTDLKTLARIVQRRCQLFTAPAALDYHLTASCDQAEIAAAVELVPGDDLQKLVREKLDRRPDTPLWRLHSPGGKKPWEQDWRYIDTWPARQLAVALSPNMCSLVSLVLHGVLCKVTKEPLLLVSFVRPEPKFNPFFGFLPVSFGAGSSLDEQLRVSVTRT